MEWKTDDKFSVSMAIKDIKDPPCRYCKFWKPERKLDDYGTVIYANIVLCHAKEQFGDFSCFGSLEE